MSDEPLGTLQYYLLCHRARRFKSLPPAILWLVSTTDQCIGTRRTLIIFTFEKTPHSVYYLRITTMVPLAGAVLPQDSLILATGANGYIGSHVVNQFLQHGYNVRGTVRDAKKHAWVASYFEKKYGAGKFELVEVKDLTDLETVKEALKGTRKHRGNSKLPAYSSVM